MSTSGLLQHLRAGDALGAEQEVGGDRAAGRDVGDDQGLELVEAGELLVDAGSRVVAVDERIGERDARPRARSASTAASSAARRRFQRAITFVNALSSTGSWYSSGPITP